MSDFNPSAATASRKASLVLRLSLWAGIVGPILFGLVFVFDGLWKPDYSVMSQPISYLEIGVGGWIQSVNFMVLGVLLILFALGFYQRMKSLIKQPPLLVITGFLLFAGLAFINDAIFIPAAPGEAGNVAHSVLHSIGFEVIFFSLPIAYFVSGWQLRKIACWRGYSWYSMVSALITLIPALFVLITSFVPSGGQSSSFAGLINRIFVIEILAWYVVMAIRMSVLAEPV